MADPGHRDAEWLVSISTGLLYAFLVLAVLCLVLGHWVFGVPFMMLVCVGRGQSRRG